MTHMQTMSFLKLANKHPKPCGLYNPQLRAFVETILTTIHENKAFSYSQLIFIQKLMLFHRKRFQLCNRKPFAVTSTWLVNFNILYE
ncbi:hypothetical protein C0J52_05334 [Blattella germanica]|nr:hypothetical protein C0J52_05334 [Blattella germanica]